MTKKFDFKDITIVPEIISSIDSRKEVNVFNSDKRLPIIVSPMDTVVSEDNCDIFYNLGLEVCLPRTLSSNNKRVSTITIRDSYPSSRNTD